MNGDLIQRKPATEHLVMRGGTPFLCTSGTCPGDGETTRELIEGYATVKRDADGTMEFTGEFFCPTCYQANRRARLRLERIRRELGGDK